MSDDLGEGFAAEHGEEDLQRTALARMPRATPLKKSILVVNFRTI
jgi:hypothetical protein